MIEKTITYTDYDGVERTETFYFNLSAAEIMQMEVETPGGFTSTLTQIMKSRDLSQMAKIFRELIRKSYGVKSPDGRRFIKNDEVFNEFAQTEAYAKLYMELATDDEAASEFVNGIIPVDKIEAQLKSLQQKNAAKK